MHQGAQSVEAVLAGRYHAEFRRIDGRWWFHHRHMLPDLVGDLSTHLNRPLEDYLEGRRPWPYRMIQWATGNVGRHALRTDAVLERVSSMAQTCGVYPASLRESMRDALAGVQRVVTLGGAAANGDNQAIAQDGIEVLRRMCRWIVDEGDPAERAIAPGFETSTESGCNRPSDSAV